jgi:hypothetical protein
MHLYLMFVVCSHQMARRWPGVSGRGCHCCFVYLQTRYVILSGLEFSHMVCLADGEIEHIDVARMHGFAYCVREES